jgi:hypothetical protein
LNKDGLEKSTAFFTEGDTFAPFAGVEKVYHQNIHGFVVKIVY